MRIRILSDLHHEHFDGKRDIPDVPADVVVLAGDIHSHELGVKWAAKTFGGTPVIYVPGNHEFYHAHIGKLDKKLRALARKAGLHYLEKDGVVIDGVRFLGTTLWTDFELYGPEAAEIAITMANKVIPDFRCIETELGRYTPQESIARHHVSKAWLTEQLDIPFEGKTVVVTHHAPSGQSVPEQFKGDRLSPAFSSNLDDLVARADLWIHGHAHNCFDYPVGKGRIVANPGGYPNENSGFDPMLVIELQE